MAYDIVSMVPDFCDVFVGRAPVAGGLPFPDRIERERLDLSLESLHAVDRYLDFLHEYATEIGDQEYTNVVLAAGCYVGEVFRAVSPTTYRWMNRDDYVRRRPDMAKMLPEHQPGVAAMLVADSGKMWLPLNKIARYIGEGPENNTHFFVAAELAKEAQ
jgi:hypothetical protein